MEDQMKARIKELLAQRDQILGQVQQNTAQRQQLETAYQQTNGAIAALYEFAPPEEGQEEEGAEATNQNGQVVEEELAVA
tara:strand:- start:207 stop:446 length:240 start_codon:yes stop_codon:yes gene_type:complete